MKSLAFVIVAAACMPDVDHYPVQPASQPAPYSATFLPDAGGIRDAGSGLDGGIIPLDAPAVPLDAGAPTTGPGTILDAASVPLDAF